MSEVCMSSRQQGPAEAAGDLVAAACTGDSTAVRNILDAGVPVNSTITAGATALHGAAHAGHVEVARQLLAAGADVTAVATRNMQTALHIAASGGHTQAVAALLDAAAPVGAADRHGITALHAAAQKGHVKVVRQLLASGADVTAKTAEHMQTALYFAAADGHAQVTAALLAAGAAVDAVDQHGSTALHAAADADSAETLRLLLAAGANVAAVNAEGDTALQNTALSGSPRAAAVLLSAGADPNTTDHYGFTPLHNLAQVLEELSELSWQEECEVARLLVASGADLEARNPDGHTPVQYAVRTPDSIYHQMVQVLLGLGANLQAADVVEVIQRQLLDSLQPTAQTYVLITRLMLHIYRQGRAAASGDAPAGQLQDILPALCELPAPKHAALTAALLMDWSADTAAVDATHAGLAVQQQHSTAVGVGARELLVQSAQPAAQSATWRCAGSGRAVLQP